jgi:ferrochelatase
MPRFAPEPPHQHGAPQHTALVLVNLGTPEQPTAPALRRYLKEFLSDPRVVEIPRPVWWLILNGIILNVRPAKSAEKYAKVWMPEGSPLKVYTVRQATLLKGLLGERSMENMRVEWAMRYGNPGIQDTLDRLKQEGCTRILILPLYPQYAASTTASVMDEVADWIKRTRNLAEIRTVRNYHDDPAYINALAASVRDHWAKTGRGELLLMSFHGLPRRSLDLGDPYFCECHKTGRLLAEALSLTESDYRITFQSRFGRAEWLQPYTQPTLEQLPSEDIKKVDVVCPGFVADCLETLEEIAMECKAAFLTSGGEEFHYIPCLNDRPDWIAALADIATRHLGGWPTTSSSAADAATFTAAQAKKFGATT